LITRTRTSYSMVMRNMNGYSITPEFWAWSSMRQRCLNANHPSYKNYGGRGIKVFESWLGIDGFQNFILDMDWRPSDSHSLDRINNDGDYNPSNCRWTTKDFQQHNRRNYNRLGFKGVTKDRTIYRVEIQKNGLRYYISGFKTPEEAAMIYDCIAERLYYA
jgi:hypothetical protein